MRKQTVKNFQELKAKAIHNYVNLDTSSFANKNIDEIWFLLTPDAKLEIIAMTLLNEKQTEGFSAIKYKGKAIDFFSTKNLDFDNEKTG